MISDAELKERIAAIEAVMPFEILCDSELSVLEQVSQHRHWLRLSWETADNFLQALECDLQKPESEP